MTIAVAPLRRIAGATSGTLASEGCAKAANPLVCRSAFSRLPTVESNGFERGTAAAGRCKALQCGRCVDSSRRTAASGSGDQPAHIGQRCRSLRSGT